MGSVNADGVPSPPQSALRGALFTFERPRERLTAAVRLLSRNRDWFVTLKAISLVIDETLEDSLRVSIIPTHSAGHTKSEHSPDGFAYLVARWR